MGRFYGIVAISLTIYNFKYKAITHNLVYITFLQFCITIWVMTSIEKNGVTPIFVSVSVPIEVMGSNNRHLYFKNY